MPLLHENYVYPFSLGVEGLVSVLAAEGMSDNDESRYMILMVDELQYLKKALEMKLMQPLVMCRAPRCPFDL